MCMLIMLSPIGTEFLYSDLLPFGACTNHDQVQNYVTYYEVKNYRYDIKSSDTKFQSRDVVFIRLLGMHELFSIV